MPRPKGKIIPHYVSLCESTMAECFDRDLWRLPKSDQDKLILAACDAYSEDLDASASVEIAVFDCWREMQGIAANSLD